MTKRMFSFLVLAIVIAGGVFAQRFSISAGAGEYFTSDFGGGIEASISGQTVSVKTPYAGGGGFVFFDATYAELSLGIFGAGGPFKQEGSGQSSESGMAFMGLDIGLLVKYPFSINDRLALFPLLGVTYRLMLSAKDADKNQYKNFSGDDVDSGDFSALWLSLGGGLDFFVTDNVYIRHVENYGIRLANTFENDADKTLLGHGFEMRFSVGYRF
jgi:opacity protein-like surface antigen